MPIPEQLGPPLPVDTAAIEAGWRRLQRIVPMCQDRELAEFLTSLPDDPELRPLLDGIFSGSPFLAECMQLEPDVLRDFATSGPDPTATRLLTELGATETSDRTRLMSSLRRSRRRLALLVGLADLAGRWSLAQVTATLTQLADGAVGRVVRHLLGEAVQRGDLEPSEPGTPELGSGLIVLAMGKHGAFELNYSSDIDLIVLFDEETMPCRLAEGPMALTARLTRALVHILEHKTKDGYVFRTDLRLRPHLPHHPLVISTEAAELYYERHGQNWERAAFIKARAIAGDIDAGERFLRILQPYVWRKHLDYAAIRDIHSIKRQINAHRGFGSIRVPGYDLKVGRGGIREIEFFAQTQQLILGGKVRELRERATLETLTRLAAGRWVAPETSQELTVAYRLLRALEHRLQMVADKQTQALPAREQEMARFAAFAGFTDAEALSTCLLETLTTVERHYAALFEAEADLGVGGNLVFTGTEDDPDTLETLRNLGFKDPVGIASRIRAWHHGHVRATRSTRARELLTELTPAMLDGLVRQSEPDAAFKLFDEFVTGLPAGVQLFSLLRANPRLLQLLANIMGAAPRMAKHLARNTDLFEALLQPDFFEALPDAANLQAELASRLKDARDQQDVLDLGKRWAHGRQFQAGIHVLLGLADAEGAAACLTAIAETVVEAVLPRARSWLAAQHGDVADGAFVVVGLGKLGSRELTTGSDLDLVFVYEVPADASTDGPRPLKASELFGRLGLRLISALTTRTAEGQFFEIDTRLRPSGNAGPVACSFENFASYHDETSEIWEQQAMTRARVVAGDTLLAKKVTGVIERLVRRTREIQPLARSVRAMRMRIFKEHGSADPWNLKHAKGGMVEIEFAAQFLVLAHAARFPTLHRQATTEVIDQATEQGLLEPEEGRDLRAALVLHHALQAVLRLSTSDRFEPDHAPAGVKSALLQAARRALPDALPLADFAALTNLLVESQQAARQVFDRLCPPADATTNAGKETSDGAGSR